MICAECAWEGTLRRTLASKGTDFAAHVAARPSMAGRGHQACPGGTWCCCQHRLPQPDGSTAPAAGAPR